MPWLFLLLAFLLGGSPAYAQLTNCQGLNTTTFSSTGSPALIACTVRAGPTGNIFVTATAQSDCSADEQLQLVIGNGSSPIAGASFTAQITSGSLIVASMAIGSGTTPFLIQSGQTLFDKGGGIPAGITINAYTSGSTPGGVGTYSLNGSPPNVASESMWSLPAPAGGTTAISNALKQTQCTTGYRAQSIAGGYTGSPGATYWIGLNILSLAGQWVEWNNQYMIVFGF